MYKVDVCGMEEGRKVGGARRIKDLQAAACGSGSGAEAEGPLGVGSPLRAYKTCTFQK